MMVPPAKIKGVVFMDFGNAFNTEPLYCVRRTRASCRKADPCVVFPTAAPRSA